MIDEVSVFPRGANSRPHDDDRGVASQLMIVVHIGWKRRDVLLIRALSSQARGKQGQTGQWPAPPNSVPSRGTRPQPNRQYRGGRGIRPTADSGATAWTCGEIRVSGDRVGR